MVSKRATSSRLKPIRQDPLEAIGLPSKGEKRLASSEAQRHYYQLLLQRAADLGLSSAGTKLNGYPANGLENSFSALSLAHNETAITYTSDFEHNLAIILGAMRKLRESIIAMKRYDAFTTEVYLFIIRSTIPIEQHEAYHPALLHALRVLSRHCRFSSDEIQELAVYAVLDLAGRQDAMREAWETAWHHGLFPMTASTFSHKPANKPTYRAQTHHIKAILRSAIHLDVLTFHRHKRELSPNEQILLRPLERRLITRAATVLSRAYFSADMTYVEKLLDQRWSNDREKQEREIARATSSWQAEEDKLVFRRPKAN